MDEQRELESKLRYVKAKVSEELLARFDRKRKWTERAGEYELKANISDEPQFDYDRDKLALVLTQLIDEQAIDREAMDAALEQVISWKLRKSGLEALRKSPHLRERIDACRTEIPEPKRYVQVRRLRP